MAKLASAATARALQELLATAPTVTAVLEGVAGARVVADVTSRFTTPAPAGNALGVESGHPLAYRAATLRSIVTARPYVWAESVYAPERLPAGVVRRLDQSSDPIGRVLVEHGATIEKSALGPGDLHWPTTWASAEVPGDVVWARAYLLSVDGQAAFAIYESFLAPLVAALLSPGPPA